MSKRLERKAVMATKIYREQGVNEGKKPDSDCAFAVDQVGLGRAASDLVLRQVNDETGKTIQKSSSN